MSARLHPFHKLETNLYDIAERSLDFKPTMVNSIYILTQSQISVHSLALFIIRTTFPSKTPSCASESSLPSHVAREQRRQQYHRVKPTIRTALATALQGLELLVAPAIFVFNYKRMPKDFNHLPASRDSNELRSDGFQMSRTYGARFLYLQILLGSHEEHGQPLPQHGMSLGHF